MPQDERENNSNYHSTTHIIMKISLRPWEQSGGGSGEDGNISHSPATHNHTNNNDDKSVRLKDIKDTMAELRNDVSSIHQRISGEVKLLNGKMEQLEECVIKCLEGEPTIIKEDISSDNEHQNINGAEAAEVGERGFLHSKENEEMTSNNMDSNKKQQGRITKQKKKKRKKAKKKQGGNSTPTNHILCDEVGNYWNDVSLFVTTALTLFEMIFMLGKRGFNMYNNTVRKYVLPVGFIFCFLSLNGRKLSNMEGFVVGAMGNVLSRANPGGVGVSERSPSSITKHPSTTASALRSTLPARPGISNIEQVTKERRSLSESSLLRTTNHNQSPHAIQQSVVEGGEQVLFYPDWYSPKCADDPGNIFSPRSFATLEECCEQWGPSMKDECILNSFTRQPSPAIQSSSPTPTLRPSHLSSPPSSHVPTVKSNDDDTSSVTTKGPTADASISPTNDAPYISRDDDENDTKWRRTFVPDLEPISLSPASSPKPTTSPSPINLLTSHTTTNCIEIEVVYDEYTEDTSWKLHRLVDNGNDDYELVDSHQAEVGDISHTQTVCLEDGEYEFNIRDSYGDGLTGDGHYTVTSLSNGALIGKGQSEITSFSIPFIPYPSMSPSFSIHPTTTPKPTDSPTLTPSLGPQCEGSNPQVCGCGSVYQSDYRGTINTAKSGKECLRWDETEYFKPENFPDAGLEDNNNCRNPHADSSLGTWCYTVDGEMDYCDVPYCFPPPSSCTSSLDANIITGMSEELQAACAYYQCVVDSDYSALESHDSLALVRAKVKPECACAFETWDCKFGSKDCVVDTTKKNANKCCASKATDPNWTTKTASCECFIRPVCEGGNSTKCNYFAENCCQEDDQQCECEYKTKACRLALELNDLNMAETYCGDYIGGGAVDACCGADNDDIGGCKCDFWEPLCTDFPNSDHNPCSSASSRCCGLYEHLLNYHCNCDLFTHAVETGYKDMINGGYYCTDVSDIVPDRQMELESLQTIFNETGGEYWLNNTGWMTSELNHCDWYGITCDEQKEFVIEINLPSNNVNGEFPSNSLSKFYKLKILNLRNNTLHGIMAETYDANGDGYDESHTSIFFNLRELAHVDLSQNNLSGEVDVLFAPSLEYANFSHNNFTSINSFKRFKQSHQTLCICDVSYNSITTSASGLLKNMPPNIEQLILSNNLIHGPLPTSLEHLANLIQFDMGGNMLSGGLPDVSTSYPNLQVLDLSEQNNGDNTGFVGTIPEGLVNLQFLSALNLAGNELSGTISPVLSNFAQLKVLDLSNNKLSQSIPKELGKLGDLEIINLSDNQLTGKIPVEIVNLQQASVHLSGNLNFSNPAPLELCFHPQFDIKNDTSLCPIERNALRDFYYSTKGGEWTDNEHWLDQYGNPCKMPWFGVSCTNDVVTELNLANNGLSGKLSPPIASLSSLEVLDLSDNDIKGTIPKEIGNLTELTLLRLSFNAFVGTVPKELGNLENLELIHLHGNRLSGEVPQDLHLSNSLPHEDITSFFITDCGLPTDFDEPLLCEQCTMCCNSDGDCHSTERPNIEEVELAGFESYAHFLWVFLLFLLGYVCLIVLASLYCDCSSGFATEQSTITKDKKYALEAIGEDSVYSFYIGKSLPAWGITLAVTAVQIAALFMFVRAAVKDFTSDRSDFQYSWKCPRDSTECTDESDLDWQGWALFVILMAAHVLKDIINGLKLLILSGKRRHDRRSRMQYFIGGFFLTLIPLFAVYASTVYNIAIARSNTDIIINTVIILFICDIDEYFYGAYKAASSFWTDGEENRTPSLLEQQIAALTERNRLLEEQNTISQQSLNAVLEQNKLLLDQNKMLLGKNVCPQDSSMMMEM